MRRGHTIMSFAQHVDEPHGTAGTPGSRSPRGKWRGSHAQRLAIPTSGARDWPARASRCDLSNGPSNFFIRPRRDPERTLPPTRYNLYARFGK
jgi:hypothetical protein